MGDHQVVPQWISICAQVLGDWRLALLRRVFPHLSFTTWIKEPVRRSGIIYANIIPVDMDQAAVASNQILLVRGHPFRYNAWYACGSC